MFKFCEKENWEWEEGGGSLTYLGNELKFEAQLKFLLFSLCADDNQVTLTTDKFEC